METVGVVDLAQKWDGRFPAVADQDAYLQPACAKVAADYAGGDKVITDKKLTVYWDNVTEDSWKAGSRKVNCNLAALLPDRSGFAPVAGSVKGAVSVGNQPAPPAPDSSTPGAPASATDTPTSAAAPTSAPTSAPAEPDDERDGRPRRRQHRRRCCPLPSGLAALPVHVRLLMRLTRREFEGLVADALDTIPPDLLAAMDNVVVLVEGRNAADPELLGLYEGVALTERTSDYGGVLPDRITIYQDAIVDICADRDEVVHEVAVTVVHEIAHHFGIDEETLHELGWG